jgi:hypothetical protein
LPVDVCPVDCILPTKNGAEGDVDPEEYIDCGTCKTVEFAVEAQKLLGVSLESSVG